MTSISNILTDVFTELKAIEGGQQKVISESLIPTLVDTNAGYSIKLSDNAVKLLARCAKQLRDSNQNFKNAYADTEFQSHYQKVFASVIPSIDLSGNPTENANIAKSKINDVLNENVARLENREFLFACTLFSSDDINPFNFGAVKFEHRNDWLQRKFNEGHISKVSKARIERFWVGKKLKKRTFSIDQDKETLILDTIGSARYVCSVTTKKLSKKYAEKRAVIAAQIAISAIMLFWNKPAARSGDIYLHYDLFPQKRSVISFDKNGGQHSGYWQRVRHPIGSSMTSKEITERISKMKYFFSMVGEVVDFSLHPTGDISRKKILNTLAQALNWFYEGCTHTKPQISTTMYAACLDTLANGKYADGIKQLLKARLSWEEETIISKQMGLRCGEAVNQIYTKCRNKAIHGDLDKFGEDWTYVCGVAEEICRHTLMHCIDYLEDHPNVEDPEDLKS